jgi:hypothetical protein
MIRRRSFGVLTAALVVVALGAVAFQVLATGEDRKTTEAKKVEAQRVPAAQPATGKHDAHHEEFDKCARACSDCQRACGSCATHCASLLAEGKKEHMKTMQTCQDCADHCAAAAQIVSRRGPFADLICKACADACARCATACALHPADAHMKACADECRRCEKSCRGMLEHAAAAGVGTGR